MWTARSDRAIAEFKEAIKLNPSFAAAHAVLGSCSIAAVNLRRRWRASKGVSGSARAIRACSSGSADLAAAHYQLAHYSQAIEIGRRSWTLNRNYITGLTYVVAGLAQLGQIDEARVALAALKELDPKLAAVRMTLNACTRIDPESIISSKACVKPGSSSRRDFAWFPRPSGTIANVNIISGAGRCVRLAQATAPIRLTGALVLGRHVVRA